ncbi:transglycosylase domain-containing protein [Thalassobacillus hwangdonensis]|uniref:Transglycosylase domain-containing protein n=1 Tax=Thalassobacillus hwangdonensis TaxID=546108 RepID=A0ABW3KZT5_9BACI
MSENQKFNGFMTKLKEIWRKGTFQKSGRITYDVVWNIILFFIIIGVVSLFFAGGVGAGYFASLVKDENIRSKAQMEQDVYNYTETSELYFDNEEYLGKIRSDLYREEVGLGEISEHLKNAVIATEDEFFHTHNGVVPKAIARAIVQEVTNSNVKTGGSTLTQQLIKNQILTNEVSFERKAKEILLALRLERFFEKDEILEAYLNIVPFGRNANGQNIAGAQTAAEGIFGVEAKDLNLAQAAFIAGLPQSPTYYSPFTNGGEVKSEAGLEPSLNRMREVLSRMLENEYINQAEYEKALAYDIRENFTKPTDSSIANYPWLTFELEKRAMDKLGQYLATQDGHSVEDYENDADLNEEYKIKAERELRRGGYKVHSTIDKEMHDIVQKVKNEYENYGADRTLVETNEETGETTETVLPVQVGSTIIENKTGKIKAFIGGRDFDKSQVNYATDSQRTNGSTMKPVLVYAPAMELGEVQPGSVIADTSMYYTGTDNEVTNYTMRYHGFTSAREALKKSYNVPAVKTYKKIINKNPKQFMDKMGYTTIPEAAFSYESSAIGTTLVTNEENTNAYATFGNMGKFVDAYMIDRIETKDGKIIYQHESEAVDVFSPQTAYLMVDMMRDVLRSGTAAGVPPQLKYSGVDWAGKTGTTNDYKDTWFIATNPNVTVSMWMGYDRKFSLNKNGYSSRNTTLWSKVVNALSDVRPELMVPDSGFQSPGGLVTRSYCASSGMAPSELCSKVGLVESDIFNSKFAPNKKDNSLIGGDFVKVKDRMVVAGAKTPSEFIIEGGGVMLNPAYLKENNLNKPEVLKDLIPNSARWDKVALPSGDSIASSVASSDEIKDDGKNPAAPGGISASGSAISWSASGSNDVVGYRIYRSAKSGANFSLLGSTTDLSYNFSGKDGYYAVRAVDYFGRESSLSKPVKVGTPDKKEEKPKPPKKDKPKEDPKPDDPEPEDNDDNEGDNGGTDDGGDSGEGGSGGNDDSDSGGDDEAGGDSGGGEAGGDSGDGEAGGDSEE